MTTTWCLLGSLKASMKSHFGIDCNPSVVFFLTFRPSTRPNKSSNLLRLRSSYLGNRMQACFNSNVDQQKRQKPQYIKCSYGTEVCRTDSNCVVSFLISNVVFATTCGDKSVLAFGTSRASRLEVKKTNVSKSFGSTYTQGSFELLSVFDFFGKQCYWVPMAVWLKFLVGTQMNLSG